MTDKEERTVSETAVEINSWDDWFKLCGTLVDPLREYEDLMADYFFNVKYGKSDEEQHDAQMEYQAKHKRGWFSSEPALPARYLFRVFIGGAVGLVVGFLLAVAVLALRGNGFHRLAITGIMLAVLGCVAGIILIFELSRYRASKIFKRLAELERGLEPGLEFIPPKYRNRQSVEAFWDVNCSYGITSFAQAVNAVDDYLVKNNLVGLYMAVLFDAPYTNGDNGAYAHDTGRMSDNPALPVDIGTKVHEGVKDPEKVLDSLIGLENVKQQVRQMKNRMNFYGEGGNENISGSHMVFLGPPGTGKSTVAGIITRILYDYGYIAKNCCVEIEGTYLKSPYAGQTGARTEAIIDYAMGGVLFIDEAYTLTEDKNGSQGDEALGVLLKAMEDHRADFVCIMAGYEDDMNRMLSSNEGFASRIKYKIYFENFTTDELGEIFRGYLRNGMIRYKIEKNAFEILKEHFARERKQPGFGNARVVRNAYDSLIDIHADAFQNGEIPEEKRFVITSEDVEKYIEVRKKQMVEDGRNFIASRNLDSSVISLQELKQKTKPGSEHPDEDMAALTGLSVVKDEIKRMKAQFSFYDGEMENDGMHMAFVGPPGTGKTTVAGIITGYLYQMNLISENSYLDINGDFLRGMYLGHTGKRTEAVIQYSQGMVLFIDEAYLLTSNNGTVDSFGQEAIGVLLDAMEKYRKDFVVIFAGYEKEMNEFLDANSGLQSRISMIFHFQSYSPHELAGIFRSVAGAQGFSVDKDVWIPLQKYFRVCAKDPHFGNGRFVRQFFESVKKAHIMNFADGEMEDDRYRISLKDVMSADSEFEAKIADMETSDGEIGGIAEVPSDGDDA